jgi:FlaA1/EpsC-like NDP-sugar epimerase
MENLAASMIIAIGTFLISFIFSYVILVLITGQLYDIMFSISLIIYTVFFFCAYRLGDVVIRRIDHLIFRLRGTSDMDRVIIFGAGDAGKYLVDLLNNDKTKHLRAVAFIDDNPLLEGKKIKGLPVVGPAH